MVSRLRGQSQGRWRWVLRDVDFNISPGESVGLFGSNGSGKSTLLKLLARVMFPYAGRLEVTGRVGALIEIRAGIHPDLTGRENIYLSGMLLGLSRSDITRRFDEIVAFAELEEAVDRQIKFYSSGMGMRLGFSVAAFLEPDVLLVDEVLAVGDASFQAKCLARMRAVLYEGTTLVFVSHDLASIEASCQRGVWLSQGAIRADAPIRDALAEYRRAIEEEAAAGSDDSSGARVIDIAVLGPDGGPAATWCPVTFQVTIDSDARRKATVCLGVSEGPATPIFLVQHALELDEGPNRLHCRLSDVPLARGHYYVWGTIFSADGDLSSWKPLTSFDIDGPQLISPPLGIQRLSPIHVSAVWDQGTRHES